MITVARFSFPYEAQIAKAALESEGLKAFIADEHTINMDWLYSNAMGGVRLQVPPSQVELAREILSKDYSEAVEELAGSSGYKICEACGSHNLEPYTKGKKPAYLVFLLAGLPLFFYRHGYRCLECGHFKAN